MDTGFEQELSTLFFFFLLQHRFLPCENKSKAVEQVKNDFNKVSLGHGKENAWNVTSVRPLARAERGPDLFRPNLECGNQQMV